MRLRPQDPDYTPGPVVTSSHQLLDWLAVNASEDRPWFRLAVHVCFADEHRLAIGSSHLVAGEDRVAVFLDGTRMSLSLLDELRFRIPESSQCATVWMEGQWVSGTGGHDDQNTAGDAVPRMVVRRVGEVVDPAVTEIRPSVGELPPQ